MAFKNLEKTSIHKVHEKETTGPANKVIAMSSTSVSALPRMMTHDERRIIDIKLEDVHLGGGGGYIKDWSDEKVAKDLNVPRAWVTKVREDYYGSDTNEQTSVLADAAKLVSDIKQVHTDRIKCDETLWERIAQIEAAIANLKH
jgi:hypothetical protein